MAERKITALAATVAVLGALALVPSGLGGRSCPQADGGGCEPIGARPGADLGADVKKQRVRLAPRLGLDGRGQQVWRAGNHLMQ
jgi:hypothetical protein